MSAMEEIILEESKRKEEKEREKREKEKLSENNDRPWLHKGIVVKLTTKRLGEKFHKKKAVVKEVLEDKYTALVKLIESGEKVRLA